ncbi:DUF4335 domain-containing protein [Coleofasciculus sp. LEGE 07092]|nr:DUF4335 domain-containing protein [Coleofasciculus sp. LEGE 07092]
MPLSNSVLRRYTPPTCTLEIVGKTSPLSRWVGTSVFKDLHFELHFDDPRQPTETKVTIRGDRTKLDHLYDAVSNYVQNFLNSSEMPLSLAIPTLTGNGDEIAEDHNHSSAFSASWLTLSKSITPQRSAESFNELDFNNVKALKPRSLPKEVHLKPKNLVAHQLFLGHLANEESGSVINLSALQLLDLATALDEYAAEIIALPNLNRSRGKKILPIWAQAAAAVVLAVGVSTAGIKFLNSSKSAQEATAPTTEENSAESSSNLAQVPPLPTAPTSPLPSPLPTPVTPPSLSPAPTLTPPEPVKTPPPQTSTAPPVSPPRQSISISPPVNPSGVQSAPNPGSVSSPPASPPTRSSNPPSLSGTTPPSQTPRRTSDKVPTTPPPLPTAPSLQKNPPRGIPSLGNDSADASASQSLSQEPRSAASDRVDGRLFDTIPQVAQARNYLQQRWLPPEELTKTLEYRLWLSSDGSIERIYPVGNAASIYIDRTGIPLIGEPFVSPVEGGSKAPIRAVLYPDGKVETFLEKID